LWLSPPFLINPSSYAFRAMSFTRLVGNISRDQKDFRAQLLGLGRRGLRSLSARAVVQGNIETGAGQMQHCRPTDSGRSTGYQRPFPRHHAPEIRSNRYLCE